MFELNPFDFIEIVLEDESRNQNGKFIILENDVNGKRRQFCVLCMIKVDVSSNEDNLTGSLIQSIYGVCKEMNHLGERTYKIETGSFCYLIDLDFKVRKLFAHHACWKSKVPCRRIGELYNHSGTFEDQLFVLKGRCDGFPPRNG